MIFIIVPAYNESKNTGRVISGLFEQADKLRKFSNNKLKVLLVDDGSTDNTGQIARRMGVIVLRHEINRGQGAALQTGNEYSLSHGAEWAVHFDGDGQFNPADIAPALAEMDKQAADAVLGSRFLDNRSQVPWTKKYVVLLIGRWLNRFFTGLKLTDAHNGFRILNRQALEKIKITQDRMAHNSEIVRQIKKHKLKFIEFPVEVKYDRYGQGIKGGLEIVKDLLMGRIF